MGAHQQPSDAYWSFFERFNARDAAGWAGAMSYPHVRVSAAIASGERGQIDPRTASRVYPTAADYAAGATEAGWERFEATGWVRTQGITPRLAHWSAGKSADRAAGRAANKAHLAGGWTRHRADDSEIVSNRVLYVMTRTAEGWGIQARFGVDSWSRGADTSASAAGALEAAERSMSLLNAGDWDAWSRMHVFPYTVVGVGELTRAESRDEFLETMRPPAGGGAIAGSARIVNCGALGANVAIDVDYGGQAGHAIVLAVRREGEWKLAAISNLSADAPR